ncbi:Triose-phosphate Transporter [Allomyces javanicus]|nr:Triose-phosphate Transporter [Allomyces javanicus]
MHGVPAAPGTTSTSGKLGLTAIAAILGWYLLSASLNLYNKWFFGVHGYHLGFPVLATACHALLHFTYSTLCLALCWPHARPSAIAAAAAAAAAGADPPPPAPGQSRSSWLPRAIAHRRARYAAAASNEDVVGLADKPTDRLMPGQGGASSSSRPTSAGRRASPTRPRCKSGNESDQHLFRIVDDEDSEDDDRASDHDDDGASSDLDTHGRDLDHDRVLTADHDLDTTTAPHPPPPPPPAVRSWRKVALAVVPCGMATALDIGLSNASLKTLSLSFYTMVKSTTPFWVMVFALVFRLEQPSWRLAASMVTMSIGMVLMVSHVHESAFDPIGFFQAIVASIMGGLRMAAIQLLLHKSDLHLNHPLATNQVLAPVMFCTLLPTAFLLEPVTHLTSMPAFATAAAARLSVLLVVAGGTLAFTMLVIEYRAIQLTSGLTLSVAGIVKEVGTIVLSVLIFGDVLTALNIVGLFVCLAGIALYHIHQQQQSRIAAAREIAADLPSPRMEMAKLPAARDGHAGESLLAHDHGSASAWAPSSWAGRAAQILPAAWTGAGASSRAPPPGEEMLVDDGDAAEWTVHFDAVPGPAGVGAGVEDRELLFLADSADEEEE